MSDQPERPTTTEVEHSRAEVVALLRDQAHERTWQLDMPRFSEDARNHLEKYRACFELAADLLEQESTPVSDGELSHLVREAGEWSDETFGHSWNDGDAAGVPSLYHLREEIDELIASPGDLTEWADVVLLLFDAARRRQITVQDIIVAAREKFEVNKRRKWRAPDENGVVRHVDTEDAS